MELDKLYNRDCIAGMGQIPEGSIDLAFADPPFNIGYKYDVYEDRLAADEYLDWTRKWGAALVRTLKADGTFWLAIGDDFAAELKLIFQRELGLCCRSWVIWYYTFGVNCKYKFSRSHTHLFHFVKDRKKATFNTESIRVPSARQLVYGDVRADSRGRLPDDTWILRPQDAPDAFQRDEDTWYIPRVCGTFKERAGWHGCQMPEQLLGRIIKSCSNPGETVLDPFGGSGTTLAVAKKLNRRFIGFELSKEYAKKIQKRLDIAKVSDSLLGAEDPFATVPTTPDGKHRDSTGRRQYNNASKGVLVPRSKKNGRETAVAKTPKPEVRKDIDCGIIEAFHATRDGFPVDRVIADPELNEQFVGKCTTLGVAGSAFDWNHRLMHLRKAGHLKGLTRSKSTTFEFEQKAFDRYRFACEIAIQRFEQDGKVTLDHVLCDPKIAAGFDRYVLAMLPDRPSSLKIRWFALRIRKAANYIAKASVNLSSRITMAPESVNPFTLNLSVVPAAPGLYWLSGKNINLYVGETDDLRERFSVQFQKDIAFEFWGSSRDSLKLAFQAASPIDTNELPKHQSLWISDWSPIGNYSKLASQK